MPSIRIFLTLLVMLASPSVAASLFDDASTLDISLTGPLSTVIGDTGERREQTFNLEVDGAAIEVGVRLRGKSRVVHCRLPPLRLNFAVKKVRETAFAGQDKLKLVTHCKGNRDGEQNLLQEYAAYRILNVLTDRSLRARLLRVTYVDTDKPRDEPVTRFGFVIESDEEFARRVGGERLLVRDVTRTMLDEDHAALIYVFQYLIANTDWSLVRYWHDEHCCHNGKLFSVGERNYYVPYDFDMSGLVSAGYARPQPELNLRSVRVRRYRGYCTERSTLAQALRHVVSRREQVLAVFLELPGLTEKNRQKKLRYVERFFDSAEKEQRLLDEFERRCL